MAIMRHTAASGAPGRGVPVSDQCHSLLMAATADRPAECSNDFPRTATKYAAPATDAFVAGIGNPGDCLALNQEERAENVYCPRDGYRHNRWWQVQDDRTQDIGWVNECFIRTRLG